MLKNLTLVFAVLLFVSCEKSITFTPKNADPLVVVEASIENGQPPVVILSKSSNYFSAITPQILANSFIRNARVEVSNGSVTHILKEYKNSLDSGYEVYYYSIDSSNLATAFLGRLASSYSLKIIVDGKNYTATTTIPALTKKIDSLWWTKAPPNVDSNFVKVIARITDPKGFGNYVRYYTKVNDGPFLPGANSVFDDQLVDGTTYDAQVDKGINRDGIIEDPDTGFLYAKGDTVTIKQSNIDKATYDFWRTIEYSYASIGNPFSSPTKVLSNLTGGALGYFGGYAAQYKTIIIPR